MMIKKKVHKLEFKYENDFSLIGIASHENDYRLSWAINKYLNLDLVKVNDLSIAHPKHKILVNYSMYSCEDTNNYFLYNLISNKSQEGFLLPEMKNIDFVLRISGTPDNEFIKEILMKLKKIDIIITAFLIEGLTDRLNKVFIM